MLGRITPMMTTSQILADINTSQNSLNTLEQELSSGKKISQPSDDPFGAGQAINLNSDLSALNTYSDNVTDGTAWAQAADSSLTNMTNLVQRAQELVTQAANGTESAADLSASGAEINQIISAVKQEANTQYNGQYVFSGTATSTAPYGSGTNDTYQGNTGAVTRLIGPSTSLQVNVDVSSVLGNGTAGGGDGKLLDTLRSIATDMSTGTTAAVSDLSNTQLGALQTGLSSLTQLQTTVGATEDRLNLASSRIQGLQTSDTEALSNVQDADMASTMTAYTNEQAAFEAALRAGSSIVQNSLMNFLQ